LSNPPQYWCKVCNRKWVCGTEIPECGGPRVRTPKQNNSIHAYFDLLADELNAAGLDMRQVLKPSVDIPWTASSIKEFIWKPIQKAMLGKESTTELETKEVDKVFDVLNRHMGEKFNIHVPFPSLEKDYTE